MHSSGKEPEHLAWKHISDTKLVWKGQRIKNFIQFLEIQYFAKCCTQSYFTMTVVHLRAHVHIQYLWNCIWKTSRNVVVPQVHAHPSTHNPADPDHRPGSSITQKLFTGSRLIHVWSMTHRALLLSLFWLIKIQTSKGSGLRTQTLHPSSSSTFQLILMCVISICSLIAETIYSRVTF